MIEFFVIIRFYNSSSQVNVIGNNFPEKSVRLFPVLV